MFLSKKAINQVDTNHEKDILLLQTNLRGFFSPYSEVNREHQLYALAHPFAHMLNLVVNCLKLIIALFNFLFTLFTLQSKQIKQSGDHLLKVTSSIALNVLNVIVSTLSILTRNIATAIADTTGKKVVIPHGKGIMNFAREFRFYVYDTISPNNGFDSESQIDKTLNNNACSILQNPPVFF